jgi:GNAT superfamily N-acetyltransferase
MGAEARQWTVRPGTPEDSPALRELFEVVFGVPREADHYAWKFEENPAGPPILAVAEVDGRLVGQYALWPTKLRVGREVLLGAQSLDTMTHPDYRGQGMFTVLAKEAMGYAQDRGVEVLFGFPNEASYPGFVRKLDWDHIGDVPRYTRVLRPSAHPRVPSWLGGVADASVRVLPTGATGGLELRQGQPDDQQLADLLAGVEHEPQGCGVEREPGYLAWRLGPTSNRDYRWVGAYDRVGALQAVAVWGAEQREGPAVLAELIGRSATGTRAALGEVVRQAGTDGYIELRAIAHGTGDSAHLRRAGFVRRGSLPLIVRKLTSRVLTGKVHTFESWTVFGADLDTF